MNIYSQRDVSIHNSLAFAIELFHNEQYSNS